MKLNIELIGDVIMIIQSFIIILVTLFTARWTYKTFAHKEKINELKKLKSLVMVYFHKLQFFCGQIRKNKTIDDIEMKEKMELVQIHNELAKYKELNLYTRPKTREKIQNIVGRWITDSERIKAMQSRKTKEDREEAWKEFTKEYEKVVEMIDKEANKLI